MDRPSNDNDSRSRAKESRDSTVLYPDTFKGDSLTRAKKLRSPVRSNESSAPSMPTPIPALVVDLNSPIIISDDDGDEEEEEDEGEEGKVSESGSSTPKASRQSYGLSGPPPAYITTTTPSSSESESGSSQWYERVPTPPDDEPVEYEYHASTTRARATRQSWEDEGVSSRGARIPPPAYSNDDAAAGYVRQGRNMADSVSSNRAEQQSGKSEQDVLDAMTQDLSLTQRDEDSDDEDDVTHEPVSRLKPARNLRRERRMARDYDGDGDGADDGEKGKGRESA